MKVAIQRVLEPSVTVVSKKITSINKDLLILLGITYNDTEEDIHWLVNKISNPRIFNDKNDVIPLSIKEIGRNVIVVSQFTLHAPTKKGNKPSYINFTKSDIIISIYKQFVRSLEESLVKK